MYITILMYRPIETAQKLAPFVSTRSWIHFMYAIRNQIPTFEKHDPFKTCSSGRRWIAVDYLLKCTIFYKTSIEFFTMDCAQCTTDLNSHARESQCLQYWNDVTVYKIQVNPGLINKLSQINYSVFLYPWYNNSLYTTMMQ